MMVLGPGHTIGGFAASPDFKGFSVTATMGLLARALPYMSHIVVCFMRYRTNPVISITRDEAVTQMMLNDLLQRKLNQQGDSYSPMVAKRLLEAILYETLGIYAHHLDTPLAGRYKRGEELFCRFLTLVERSYKSERSIAFYADRLCVTPKHLSAVVKDASGRTAGEWIDSYVILEARTMLSSTDHTIQQISSDLNFPNQSFFGKYFKHHTGVSPREYRKNHSQE
jgi:AraC-like DNA-binding protein